jgi:hypothetical protein
LPEFRWTGRDRGGHELSGNFAGNSADEVLRALTARGIAVESLEAAAGRRGRGVGISAESGGGIRRKATYAALAIVLAIVGIGMLSVAPVDTVRCTSERDCRIERSVAGVHLLSAEELKHVTSVSLEKDTEVDKSTKNKTVYERVVVVLHAGKRSIATDPRSMPIGSAEAGIERELTAFLAAPSAAGFVARQADVAPLVIGSVLSAASLCAAFMVLRG